MNAGGEVDGGEKVRDTALWSLSLVFLYTLCRVVALGVESMMSKGCMLVYHLSSLAALMHKPSSIFTRVKFGWWSSVNMPKILSNE